MYNSTNYTIMQFDLETFNYLCIYIIYVRYRYMYYKYNMYGVHNETRFTR